jgi:PAB-dependent poly(A)-specific ribonuclease subunit 3
VNEAALQSIEAWRKIRHCGIIGLREAFTTKAFGDNCNFVTVMSCHERFSNIHANIALIFSYDYHPLSKTLQEKHFGGRSGKSATWGSGIPEVLLWSYVIQIGSALRQIHSASLAARVILPSKILVTGKNR